MIRQIFVAGLAAIGLVGGANAQSCSCAPGGGGTQVTGAALTSLLSGNTVCVPHPSLTRWEWQEQHTASGALFDEKRGTGHAVDPREQVGTWSLNTSGANSAVTHTYNTAFTWKVCKAGTAATTYGFCPGTTATIFATIKPGIVACGTPALPL